MNVVPLETVLGYLDGLVGAGASLSLASVMGASKLIQHGEEVQVSNGQFIIEEDIPNPRNFIFLPSFLLSQSSTSMATQAIGDALNLFALRLISIKFL